jgi:hypothetical protein
MLHFLLIGFILTSRDSFHLNSLFFMQVTVNRKFMLFLWLFLILSGNKTIFTYAESVVDQCEDDQINFNGMCLSHPFFDIKNQYMENWDFGDDNYGEIDVHQVYITLFADTNSIQNTIPISGAMLKISHTGKKSFKIMLPSGITSLGPGEFLNLETNHVGQVAFGVIEEDIFLPYFCIDSIFLGLSESIRFSVDSHALHELSESEDLYSESSQWSAAKNLLLPVLHSAPFFSISKRALNTEKPYDVKSNSIRYYTIRKEESHGYRLFDLSKMEHPEWNFDFSNNKFKSGVFLSDHIGNLIKRNFIDDIKEFCEKLKNATLLNVSSGGDGMYLSIEDGSVSSTYIENSALDKLKYFFLNFIKKIGIGISKALNFVKSVFNWNDILLNHNVLTSHFYKTIPWLRSLVTSTKGNFSADLSETIGNINNISQQSGSLFVEGKFSQVADLIQQTNKHYVQKLVYNPAINDSSPEDSRYSNIRGSFITNLLATHMNETDVSISEWDQETLLNITSSTFDNIMNLGNDTLESIMVEFGTLKDELSKKPFSWKSFLRAVNQIIGFVLELLLVKLSESVLVTFDLILGLFHKVLSYPINVPKITNWIQKKVLKDTTQITVYELFSLLSVIFVSTSFKATHRAINMFTQYEAEVLIRTKNPDKYIDNLVAFANAINPNGNQTHTRMMYRRSVSYILGSGYSTAHFASALVGLIPTGAFGLYFLRSPLELLSILCNFPWTWYTDTQTLIGVNMRFLAYVSQFAPFIMGWGLEHHAYIPKDKMGIFHKIMSSKFWAAVNILTLLPSMYFIVNVFLDDLQLIKMNASIDQNSFDQFLKFFGRLITQGCRAALNIVSMQLDVGFMTPFTVTNTVSTVRAGIIFGAALQVARLPFDISVGGVYSV